METVNLCPGESWITEYIAGDSYIFIEGIFIKLMWRAKSSFSPFILVLCG